MTAREEADKLISETVERFDDLSVTVQVRVHLYCVDFEVWEHSEATGPEGVKSMIYGDKWEETRTEENRFLSGHVKWDGCINWMIDDQAGNCMSHGCSREDVTKIGVLLGKLWDLGQRCPNWDEV